MKCIINCTLTPSKTLNLCLNAVEKLWECYQWRPLSILWVNTLLLTHSILTPRKLCKPYSYFNLMKCIINRTLNPSKTLNLCVNAVERLRERYQWQPLSILWVTTLPITHSILTSRKLCKPFINLMKCIVTHVFTPSSCFLSVNYVERLRDCY